VGDAKKSVTDSLLLDYFSDHCGYFILKSVKASATILIPDDTLRYFASFIFYGTNF
jgi:hypothetical protein